MLNNTETTLMVLLLKTSQSEMRNESVWADRERGRHHETKLVIATGINHSPSVKGFEFCEWFPKYWRCGGGPSEIRPPCRTLTPLSVINISQSDLESLYCLITPTELFFYCKLVVTANSPSVGFRSPSFLG